MMSEAARSAIARTVALAFAPSSSGITEASTEKQLRSVTANTPADGEEFLRLAAALRLRPTVTPHPLAEADRVLADLAAGRVTGAAVLVP